MNITEIMGHLGADPEVRFTPSGQKVIALRLATNSRVSGKDETVWWAISIWQDRCNIEKMLPYLKKGSALIVVGEMRTRLYTDKEGRPQISHELTADLVRFSPFGKPDSAKQESGQSFQNKSFEQQETRPFAAQAQNTYSGSSYGQSSISNHAEDDDAIPF